MTITANFDFLGVPMHFLSEERIAIFIDGSNLYSAAGAWQFDIDYKRLLDLFRSKGRLIRAFYYTALLEDQEYSPIRPLVDWLDYNGYTMVTKPTKEFTDLMGRRRIKGNMDIELAIDMLEMAAAHGPCGPVLGRRRFPPAGRGRAAARRASNGRLDDPLLAADGLGRSAPAGRQLSRAAGAGAEHHAQSSSARRDGRPGRSPDRRGRAGRDRAELPPPGDAQPPAAPPLCRADCLLCPRLAAFRAAQRAAHPDWFNAPVPSFGDPDPELLIVGLAPGLRGANRTGRPFTGDYAGDLLYRTLLKSGFAAGDYAPTRGRSRSRRARITNAVRCVPPQNKPQRAEIAACGRFLAAELAALPSLRVILALGAIAHDAVLAAKGLKRARYKFAHGAIHELPDGTVLADSYHCSRLNTNTGRLTPEMFEAVIAGLAERQAFASAPRTATVAGHQRHDGVEADEKS